MKLRVLSFIVLAGLIGGLASFAETDSRTLHSNATPPRPPSPVIVGIEWAPLETIVRRAKGSDNFPLTWSDDDALVTTYGDGFGFEPFVPDKLSLGLVRITGMPRDFRRVNLRSESIEQSGDDHFCVRKATLKLRPTAAISTE